MLQSEAKMLKLAMTIKVREIIHEKGDIAVFMLIERVIEAGQNIAEMCGGNAPEVFAADLKGILDEAKRSMDEYFAERDKRIQEARLKR